MCGIAGCFQQHDGPDLAPVLNERIRHRGPDGEGIWSLADGETSVQLAHRRLSIIDLSEAGAQPLRKGGLVLVYNGELYNFRELRLELEKLGTSFYSSCDTEVVLEAWRAWGPRALKRFRGMFAFAIYDETARSLFLARDPLGIKPLYLMRRGAGILFSSELKALVSAVGSELCMDPASMLASMLYYWVPDQRCSLRGVEKLPPGSFASVSRDGAVRVERYWDPIEVARSAGAEKVDDLAGLIEESVAAHLVADVPVSAFLSGGLDSSIISVLAKRSNPAIDAFTISFRTEDQRLEAMPDDAVYARKVAERFGIQLHEIEIAPDIVKLLPDIVEILDEPIGDPAAINTLLMCQGARERGTKVLLSGMGADELFGGYRKHRACVLGASYQHLPATLRQRAIRPLVDAVPVMTMGRGLRYARWAKRFLTFAELGEEEAFRRSYTLYDPPDLAHAVGEELRPLVGEILEEHREIYMAGSLHDHVNRMCLADSQLFLSGLNLTYTDRASMAASTEVRVPFVDPVVFKAAFSFSGREKVTRRESKVALKNAARAWLPDEIVDRPKASFSAPLRAWVSRDLRDMVDEVLLSGELVGSGFLVKGEIERMVEQDRAGREDYSKQVWQLLTMELWTRHMTSHGVAA